MAAVLSVEGKGAVWVFAAFEPTVANQLGVYKNDEF